jgi:hypothetical protein
MEIPWVPPSSNHAYMNNGFGGRSLAKEGRKFLLETKAHLSQNYRRELRLFKENKPYALVFRFYFNDIENKGFATGKAKARYKVFDGGNRTKLLEDALKDVGGIDDSQTITSLWEKKQSAAEHTDIYAWSIEEEGNPFNEFLDWLDGLR